MPSNCKLLRVSVVAREAAHRVSVVRAEHRVTSWIRILDRREGRSSGVGVGDTMLRMFDTLHDVPEVTKIRGTDDVFPCPGITCFVLSK